jgi:hypothetical protein
MWIESNEFGELELHYYTVDIYKSSTFIRHCSSPLSLGYDYNPLWSCDISFKALVF